MSNLDEYRAGTNPTNALSVLKRFDEALILFGHLYRKPAYQRLRGRQPDCLHAAFSRAATLASSQIEHRRR